MGLNELNDFIPDMLSAIGTFLSTGIMFYIMALLIVALIIKLFLSFMRR